MADLSGPDRERIEALLREAADAGFYPDLESRAGLLSSGVLGDIVSFSVVGIYLATDGDEWAPICEWAEGRSDVRVIDATMAVYLCETYHRIAIR